MVLVDGMFVVFGDIDNGEFGECVCANRLGVVGLPSDGLSEKQIECF